MPTVHWPYNCYTYSKQSRCQTLSPLSTVYLYWHRHIIQWVFTISTPPPLAIVKWRILHTLPSSTLVPNNLPISVGLFSQRRRGLTEMKLQLMPHTETNLTNIQTHTHTDISIAINSCLPVASKLSINTQQLCNILYTCILYTCKLYMISERRQLTNCDISVWWRTARGDTQ